MKHFRRGTKRCLPLDLLNSPSLCLSAHPFVSHLSCVKSVNLSINLMFLLITFTIILFNVCKSKCRHDNQHNDTNRNAARCLLLSCLCFCGVSHMLSVFIPNVIMPIVMAQSKPRKEIVQEWNRQKCESKAELQKVEQNLNSIQLCKNAVDDELGPMS